MTAQIGNRSRDLKATAATYPEVGRDRFTVVALPDPCFIGGPVKVVKQQINGGDRLVLKENALASDLKTEAMRLKAQFGYDVQHDKRRGTYIVSHDFFQGKFVLMLEPD